MSSQVSPLTNQITQTTEAFRHTVNALLEPETRGMLGQYMTPSTTANFMASLFPESCHSDIRLMDPGAGVGSLTSAFISRATHWSQLKYLDLNVWEVDSTMLRHLYQNMESMQVAEHSFMVDCNVREEDFVISASRLIANDEGLWSESIKKYTHCIMNPPYKKILSSSAHRKCLRTAGIETVNLYTGFVALSLMLMEEGGQLVGIVPRSFCNGPYYRPFREHLLKNSAIRHIHLFESRNKAFREDGVLQENIIIRLERGARQGDVTITSSTDDSFSDLETRSVSFSQIVSPQDKELFIHIPLYNETDSFSPAKRYSLETLGIQVSTGPIVDFRQKEYLRAEAEFGAIPLLYSCHFRSKQTVWPVKGKKPNAIVSNDKTRKGFYPKGFYVVVRRFSSKEEERRIVASVVNPNAFSKYEYMAFENHLNVFHKNKQGLEEDLAWGLTAFLNTKAVDDSFRLFSGHTQVNATDLRSMRFPEHEVLKKLGEWAKNQSDYDSESTEEKLQELEKW